MRHPERVDLARAALIDRLASAGAGHGVVPCAATRLAAMVVADARLGGASCLELSVASGGVVVRTTRREDGHARSLHLPRRTADAIESFLHRLIANPHHGLGRFVRVQDGAHAWWLTLDSRPDPGLRSARVRLLTGLAARTGDREQVLSAFADGVPGARAVRLAADGSTAAVAARMPDGLWWPVVQSASDLSVLARAAAAAQAVGRDVAFERDARAASVLWCPPALEPVAAARAVSPDPSRFTPALPL